MSETRTYWKKNNDSRYISGEDLQDGALMGKGLKPEMVVTIASFEDSETFDQQKNIKVTKTGFWLKEYPSGNAIYKQVILNNTNAYFCIDEFKSKILEDWLNKPLVLWAMPDRRHGFVARFKHYYPPAKATDTVAIASLSEATDLTQLGEKWTALSADEKKLPTVLAKKEELKKQLTPA